MDPNGSFQEDVSGLSVVGQNGGNFTATRGRLTLFGQTNHSISVVPDLGMLNLETSVWTLGQCWLIILGQAIRLRPQ